MIPERIFRTVAGYDCTYAPCRHERKGDHGIHGEQWHYIIKGDDTALELTCYTNRYPPTVPRKVRDTRPAIMGADLSLHVSFATEAAAPAPTQQCDLVGRCGIFWSVALLAREIVEKHGVGRQEQPEAFWSALEDVWRQQTAQAEVARQEAESWTRCQCCDGLGRVRTK